MIETIDPTALDASEVYKLMIGTIVPRPIGWVSTCSADGVGNLAPFSFFNGVARRPATLMFVVSATSDGSPKDTLRNIEQCPEFVVNIVSENLLEQMVQSAADYPYGVSEMEKIGLTPLSSERIRPVRVAEAKISMECKLSQRIEIGSGSLGSSTVIFGEILLFHLNRDVLNERGRVDPERLKPVGRLGGADYTKLGEIVTRPIPKL